jgi:hypothetical protein
MLIAPRIFCGIGTALDKIVCRKLAHRCRIKHIFHESDAVQAIRKIRPTQIVVKHDMAIKDAIFRQNNEDKHRLLHHDI